MKNQTHPSKGELKDAATPPKYLLLAQELRRQIQRGDLAPGQPLPPYLEIKKQHGVSKSTVEKTYQTLEAEGLIWRKPGSGVYVSEPSSNSATGLVGFVDASPSFNRNFQFYIQFVNGLREQAEVQNQCLVIIDDPANFTRWKELDGVVLSEPHFSHRSPERSWEDIRQIIPASLVTVNTFARLSGLTNVTVDEADGIRQLIGHLAEQGHRRIGYMGRMHQPIFAQHSQVQSRYRAYQNSLREFGLKEDSQFAYSPPIEYFRDYPGFGYHGMKLWLENGWRDLDCTALLAHNDRAATGMIDALREAGLRVPEDVSVTGFDGTETLSLAAYQLTTVKVPIYEVAANALKVLLAQMQNPARRARNIVLPVKLVVGQSTASLKQPMAIVA